MAAACKPWRWPERRALQRGVLLLESLTAVLLFSLGVLGTVGMQAHAIRHVSDAHYRGAAAHLALSLIGKMWTDNPRTLTDRYDSSRGGEGFREFSSDVLRLPGASLAGNAPTVQVAPGPSAGSYAVNITVRWQLPGETRPHRHSLAAVIGANE